MRVFWARGRSCHLPYRTSGVFLLHVMFADHVHVLLCLAHINICSALCTDTLFILELSSWFNIQDFDEPVPLKLYEVIVFMELN